MIDLRKKPDLSTVESDLKALTSASKVLNSLTDQLTEQVAQIESVINTLNLGLRVSVDVHSYSSDDEPWASENLRLSYDKIDGRWVFEVEQFDTDERDDPERIFNYHSWPFKDSPRSLRLEVVHKIPELLKEMVKQAEAAAAKVTEKLEDAKSIASSVQKLTLDGPVRK
jgi:hypothetical protein